LATPKLARLTLLLATLQSSLITAVRIHPNIHPSTHIQSIPTNKSSFLGHYIENTSDDETLVWLEFYKSDRVADISLAQWLALTPADTVANTLKIDIDVVRQIKKEKQVLLKGNN
jgi:hypothetical protein